MGVAENLTAIRKDIPGHVTLVAVTKTKPVEMILEAYRTGHRDFGENRAQDLMWKREKLPDDIRWHMVGHLQSNKVKFLAPFVHMIHGVDSLKLLKMIQKEAQGNSRVIDVLLQVHIAQEETKFGFSADELHDLVQSLDLSQISHVRIRGLMGMATFTEDDVQVRKEFRFLKELFDRMKQSAFAGRDDFNQLSMGMSGDYRLAVEEGSTMVRIGSLIFGSRNQ
ncbi:MAG TPA: YggS family pyridoxal phosphate-dependent enzyme [Bacteroides sp.]|nr:YggS family pyridoxal phosphate-dependent enzyme [Bacteroides sp.]